MFIRLLALVLASQIVACSSPRDANEKNYIKAIEGYFSQRDDFPHCFFRYSFPIAGAGMQWRMRGLEKPLNLLTDLGLVHHESKEVGQRLATRKPVIQHQYTLTDEGKKYYIEDRGLCIGKPRLLGLQDVSKPYEERGKTMVRGEYLWTIDLPDWAMEKRFYDASSFSGELYYFKYEKLINNEPLTDYFTLGLGDDGWGL